MKVFVKSGKVTKLSLKLLNKQNKSDVLLTQSVKFYLSHSDKFD